MNVYAVAVIVVVAVLIIFVLWKLYLIAKRKYAAIKVGDHVIISSGHGQPYDGKVLEVLENHAIVKTKVPWSHISKKKKKK